jgi:hypothetical protein
MIQAAFMGSALLLVGQFALGLVLFYAGSRNPAGGGMLLQGLGILLVLFAIAAAIFGWIALSHLSKS